MTLKTLDPQAKQAFADAGITLTVAQEHVAAVSAIDWSNLLKTLGTLATTLAPIILGLFGITITPAPVTQATGAGCPCDHHACCLKTFESAIHTAKVAGEHLCSCCCE